VIPFLVEFRFAGGGIRPPTDKTTGGCADTTLRQVFCGAAAGFTPLLLRHQDVRARHVDPKRAPLQLTVA